MKQWLIRRIRKAGENIESTSTQIFFLALFGATAAILALSKTALSFALQLANIPTPLWATISLVLLCGSYIYLKGNRYFQKKSPYHPQEALITVDRFKWKVLHGNGQVLNIEGLPYCIEHECSLIPRDSEWACPIRGCESIVSKYDLDKKQVAAASIIENLVRTKKVLTSR